MISKKMNFPASLLGDDSKICQKYICSVLYNNASTVHDPFCPDLHRSFGMVTLSIIVLTCGFLASKTEATTQN